MRRVLVGTALQAVAITAVLVGLAVAGLLLWPGDPLKSLTDQPAVRRNPAGRRPCSPCSSWRCWSPRPCRWRWPAGRRRAGPTAWRSCSPPSASEPSAPATATRGSSPALRASRRSTSSTPSSPAAPSRAPSGWRPSGTSPPTPRTSCARRSPRCSCGSRRSASTDDLGASRRRRRIALEQVERLSKVVDDLMSPHPQRGRHQPGRVAGLGARLAAAGVAADLRRGAPQHPRRGERGLAVLATPTALAQILATLIENSLQHGAGTVEISARRAGPSVVIEVADEGEGVPDDHRAAHLRARGDVGGQRARARPGPRPGRGRRGPARARAGPPAVFALFLSASAL